mmetsp:Transcript_96688/g.208620  ORF Transcript_96688/g.208620 Transcript_96688/m.208620 type:complete len:234 (+) Transcript_96688:31-732(+)
MKSVGRHSTHRHDRRSRKRLEAEGAVEVVVLDLVAVHGDATLVHHVVEHGAVPLGEAPLAREDHLLAAGELELGAAQGLHHISLVRVRGARRHEDLPDAHTGDEALGLAEGMAHARLQAIGACARKHLVDAEHVEGVNADAHVETVLAAGLDQVLVGGNAGGLESLARQLLTLVRHKMGDEGEAHDGLPLGAIVVNADLGLGHTTAVPRLDVRLVLAVAVAASGAASHGDDGS